MSRILDGYSNSEKNRINRGAIQNRLSMNMSRIFLFKLKANRLALCVCHEKVFFLS